jgi:DUF971 family protein
MLSQPSRFEVVGNTLALQWLDGEETYLDASELRANSPSAENKGEVDIFGKVSGGEAPREHLDIKILKVIQVGNYAIRIHFSDGHSTGIYSWDYLKTLSNLK